MNIFRIKTSSPPADSPTDEAIETAPTASEAQQTPVGLGDMPPEIGAAIFNALDMRHQDGIDAYSALRNTSSSLRAIGNDLAALAIKPAITPTDEAADTDMAALREQLEGLWLPEDESMNAEAALRHARKNAEIRHNKSVRRHTSVPLATHAHAIVSSSFSVSGHLMALGDAEGHVSVVDMQAILRKGKRAPGAASGAQQADRAPETGREVMHLLGSAMALGFSANDRKLAVAHCKPSAEASDDADAASSRWYVVVHDLTLPDMPVRHYVPLPASLEEVSSVALDADGGNMVVACEGTNVLYHAALAAPAVDAPLGRANLQSVKLAHRCDGEVGYTTRGTLVYGRRGGLQEAVDELRGAGLKGGTRRPFVMPRTSQVDRRATAMQPADHRRLYVGAAEAPNGGFLLHVNRYQEPGMNQMHAVSARIPWNSLQTPSVLFAPGNRHVLLTSDTGHAELLDMAPEPTREEHLQAARRVHFAEAEPTAHRRRPISSPLPGKQTIRHALNRLTGRKS